MSTTLVEELRALLNRHSVENASDTPDFVLAEYLMDCLGVWETAVSRRDKWYGFSAHGEVVMDLTNPSPNPQVPADGMGER